MIGSYTVLCTVPSHGVSGEALKPRALLFGERDRPYVCADPYYLYSPSDELVDEVLADFYRVVAAAMRQVVLHPGEVLLVDNYRAVHGRAPFTANYDGRDRWLKRISVSRDLRRCWPARTAGARQVLVGEIR